MFYFEISDKICTYPAGTQHIINVVSTLQYLNEVPRFNVESTSIDQPGLMLKSQRWINVELWYSWCYVESLHLISTLNQT